MSDEKPFKCSHCGERKNTKGSCRTEYPSSDPYTNKPVCEDCFDEAYMQFCELCDTQFPKEQSGLAVFTEETHGLHNPVQPGIYRILDYPIAMGAMIGGGFINDKNVEFLVPLPPDVDADNRRNGHVCRECAERAGVKFGDLALPVFDADGDMTSPAADSARGRGMSAEKLHRALTPAIGGATEPILGISLRNDHEAASAPIGWPSSAPGRMRPRENADKRRARRKAQRRARRKNRRRE